MHDCNNNFFVKIIIFLVLLFLLYFGIEKLFYKIILTSYYCYNIENERKNTHNLHFFVIKC
jgi:flagellar biosynthesis protein FliR